MHFRLFWSSFFYTTLEIYINEDPMQKIGSVAFKFWMWWPPKDWNLNFPNFGQILTGDWRNDPPNFNQASDWHILYDLKRYNCKMSKQTAQLCDIIAYTDLNRSSTITYKKLTKVHVLSWACISYNIYYKWEWECFIIVNLQGSRPNMRHNNLA